MIEILGFHKDIKDIDDDNNKVNNDNKDNNNDKCISPLWLDSEKKFYYFHQIQ